MPLWGCAPRTISAECSKPSPALGLLPANEIALNYIYHNVTTLNSLCILFSSLTNIDRKSLIAILLSSPRLELWTDMNVGQLPSRQSGEGGCWSASHWFPIESGDFSQTKPILAWDFNCLNIRASAVLIPTGVCSNLLERGSNKGGITLDIAQGRSVAASNAGPPCLQIFCCAPGPFTLTVIF